MWQITKRDMKSHFFDKRNGNKKNFWSLNRKFNEYWRNWNEKQVRVNLLKQEQIEIKVKVCSWIMFIKNEIMKQLKFKQGF